MPISPAELAVRQLKARGHPVELAAPRGVGHVDEGRFVEPLRTAGRWVRARGHRTK